MIDLATERLIALREVPKHLPPRPTGRRIHISAVYRWIQRGVRGVRLDSIQVGGTTYTSVEALQRFADGLSSRGPTDRAGLAPTTATRRKQIERAAREAEAILGTPKGNLQPPPANPDGSSA